MTLALGVASAVCIFAEPLSLAGVGYSIERSQVRGSVPR